MQDDSSIILISISLIILVSCLILHFYQHFKFTCCHETLLLSPRSSLNKHETGIEVFMYKILNKDCPRLFSPVDGEVFNFFPTSFVWYLCYSISLIIFILIHLIYSYQYHPLITHSFPKQYTIKSMYSLSVISVYYYSDWIIIYSILILSLWDSLFSWYRYYSTLFISTQFMHVTTCQVINKFMYYTIPYCILFIICIHFYYFLYPFIILIHICFNCYCTWKYSSILLDSYMQSAGAISKSIHNKMLNGVYFMRKIQLICCIISTISITLIVFIYNIKIVIYLPLLWSIYCILFTLNFIRNRQCISQQLFKIYQCFKFKRCCKFNNKYTQNQPIKSLSTITKPENINSDNNNNDLVLVIEPKLVLKDTKSAPMIPSKIAIAPTNINHINTPKTPVNNSETFTCTPSNVSYVKSVINNSPSKSIHTHIQSSDSAPNSPIHIQTESNYNTQMTQYMGQKRKSNSKCTVIGTIVDNNLPTDDLHTPIMDENNENNEIFPDFSTKLEFNKSYSNPISPKDKPNGNAYDFRYINSELTLERGATDPISMAYENGNGFEYVDYNINEEYEMQLLDNLTVENAKKIREINKSKFMVCDENKDVCVVDACFDALKSHGFVDKPFLNSVKQLRQFNDKKLPKNIIM